MKALDVLNKSICLFFLLRLYLQHHILVEVNGSRPQWQSELFLICFTMKADESADCAVRCVARQRTGPRNRRFHQP